MAYTFLRRAPRCFTCRRRNIPLYTLHGSTGACIGILCRAHASEWLKAPGVTASPLGNAHHLVRTSVSQVTPQRG